LLRRAVENVALLVASILLGFAVLEGVARILPGPQTAYAGRGLYQSDFDLGHSLRPNITSGDVVTNSLGFRDREYPVPKPKGAFRILGLGDSFTFGRQAPGEVYLDLLESRLGAGGPPFPVEVINAGVPGYDTAQEIGQLRKVGLGLGPDVVLLAFFVTGDLLENGSDERYEVVDGELTSNRLTRLDRFLLRSHLYRLVRSRLAVHAAEPPPEDALTESRYLEVEASRLAACQVRPDRYLRRCWRRTERLLLELRDETRARGIGLLVLLIPDELQVDPQVLEAAVTARGGNRADYDPDLPSRRLREFLAGAGVPAVDLLEEFRARQASEPVYRPQDTHWNAAGCAIAADRVVEALLPLLTQK
jgi:lysophospholipase L1-like esterase